MIKRISIVATIVALVSLTNLSSAVADSISAISTDSIQECISEKRNLDVLMLVDESKSLRENDGQVGNDPAGSRVEALRSVAQVLASTVDASKNGVASNSSSKPLKVSLAIAGFGAGYTSRYRFADLSGDSMNTVIGKIEAQRELDDDVFTRYHTGLAGAIAEFKDHNKSDEKVCRLLVWFSDGVHDDDNRNGFSDIESEQINSQICGEGGLADQLRTEQVFVVAAGLNADEKELGLMRLIAKGGAPFEPSVKSGRKTVAISNCGSIAPNGEFELAKKADEIIDKIFAVLKGVPGVPSDVVNLPSCADGTINCNEMRFKADDSISSFSILATRPSNDVKIVLNMPTGQSVEALGSGGQVSDQKNVAKFYAVTDKKVLITVSSSPQSPITGEWALRFEGLGSSTSVGAINFVGKAQVDLLLGTKTIVDEFEINRFKPESIVLKIKTASVETAIRDAQISLINFSGVEELKSSRSASGDFLVSDQVIDKALNGEKLGKTSSVTLRVVPVGDVAGLTTLDGKPVKVDFNSQIFQVLISNGDNLPLFKGVKETDLKFIGTETKPVTFLFDGPDSGDGSIDFGQISEKSGNKADFEVISQGPCIVQQKKTDVECLVKLVPNKGTYGGYVLQLAVKYKALNEDITQDGEISIPVKTILPTDIGDGFGAAFKLILIFAIVQGLVRLLIAYLLSKYAPLSATARKVKIGATISAAGELVIAPMATNLSNSDEGFALENVDSVSSFNIFGYTFDCSVIQTFVKSTTAPVGIVSTPETVVIGSRGVQFSKKSPEATEGLVELSLRGQWIVGVKVSDIKALVSGASSVPAEIVAFFEPYEISQRVTQETGLSFAISSSSFASDFSSAYSRLVAKEPDTSDQNTTSTTDDVWSDASTQTGGDTTQQFDQFGENIASVAQAPIDEPKSISKKRKNKKSKETEESVETVRPQPTTSKEEWDPFS